MSNLHFICADNNDLSKSVAKEIKEKYDFTMEQFADDSWYQKLYEHIKCFQDFKIITIGGNQKISNSTISAINERYMKQQGKVCSSDLMVLCIGLESNLDKELSTMLGKGRPLTNSKLLLDTTQLIYYGVTEDNLEDITQNNIQFITNKKISIIGPENCYKSIKKMIDNKPLHVSIDLKVFDDKKGINLEDVLDLLIKFKDNIVSMDITEFPQNNKIIIDFVRILIAKVFDIKESKINIFNEDSYFIIYRPLEQENEQDFGWYILKDVDDNIKTEILEQLNDDDIETIDIDGDDYLIAKTTINEQNKKTYYMAKTINDIALFPEEKKSMWIELIK